MRGTLPVFGRELLRFGRDKTRIVVLLVQPSIWLLFMGSIMNNATSRIPQVRAFLQGAPDYLAYMAPGIMVLGSLFSSVYCGLSLIHDRERGMLERMLASPIRRAAVPYGKMLSAATQNVAQALILIATAALAGARFRTGAPGLVAALAMATTVNMGCSALLLALTLAVRSTETYIAIICCCALPAVSASTIMFPVAFMPDWFAAAARWNPLSLAVTPIRQLMNVGWIWSDLYAGLGAAAGSALLLSALVALLYREP